jgi:alkaline phosphatase
MDRRKFLKGGTAGIVGASLLTGCSLANKAAATAQASALKSPKKPKNIIMLISDGMSQAVPTVAEFYSHLYLGQSTQFAQMLRDPEAVQGYFDTQSLSSMVTDSAAAGSAFGAGSRIANGALNMLPDGTVLTPIAELAQASGRKVGLVTTTSMAHATPASFCAAHPTRREMDEIAAKMIKHTDFMMGGGRRSFNEALQAEYKKQGFEVIHSKTEWAKLSKDKKTLGLFSESHIPYTVDQIEVAEYQENVPTLAEMTKTAIEHLDGKGEGFLLQVEGGRIDHAGHGNDAGAIFKDQIAFDDAVAVANEFARNNGETLIIVTTDHPCANPALNGMGSSYNDTTKCFQLLAKSKISFERLRTIVPENLDEVTADFAQEIAQQYYGFELSSEHATTLAGAMKDELPVETNHQQSRKSGIMGQVLGNYTGVQFTGNTHTNDLVPVIATGPGKELFAGLHPNTHAFGVITGVWDIEHINPTANTDYIPSLMYT